MKKQRQPMRSGTLTLLITCVLMLLAVLGLLSLTSAHADLKLADRQMVYAQRNAYAERLGQEWLADLDDYLRGGGDLPEDTTVDENIFAATIYLSENESLNVSAMLDEDGRLTLTGWQLLLDWVSSEDMTEALTEAEMIGAVDLEELGLVEGSGLGDDAASALDETEADTEA